MPRSRRLLRLRSCLGLHFTVSRRKMSYIRLHDPPTTQYPPADSSKFPPSKPRSFLMKLPQYGPRELKGAKISTERRRRLLLSYLPDWLAISSVCVDPPHTNSTQGHLHWTCVRPTLYHLQLISPTPPTAAYSSLWTRSLVISVSSP